MAVGNYMKKVVCPGNYATGFKETVRYANSTAKGELRCTGCGMAHDETRRQVVGEFVPISTKRRKFKKGKKPKAKGGGKGAQKVAA